MLKYSLRRRAEAFHLPGEHDQQNHAGDNASSGEQPEISQDHAGVKKYLSMVHKMTKDKSVEGFVFANGKQMTVSPENKKVKRGKMGECYKNAFNLAEQKGYEYVEGFAIPGDIPIPLAHAWCLDSEGRVIDPTWKDGKGYWGVMIPERVRLETALSRKRYGVLDNPEDGFPILRKGKTW